GSVDGAEGTHPPRVRANRVERPTALPAPSRRAAVRVRCDRRGLSCVSHRSCVNPVDFSGTSRGAPTTWGNRLASTQWACPNRREYDRVLVTRADSSACLSTTGGTSHTVKQRKVKNLHLCRQRSR